MSKVYYPAGNPNWSWEWMGFSPPRLIYNDKPLKKGYEKFRKCFDFYCGIGTFDFWKRDELIKLSDKKKIKLIKLLLEDNKDKTVIRPYLGLNPDGSINKSIDEFADGRTMFFKVLTIEECRLQKYPHNQRCRTKEGYQCDDCATFIPVDSEEYLRTEKMDEHSMYIHNLGVYFYRAGINIPPDVIELRENFDELCGKNPYEIPIDEILIMFDRYNQIREKYQDIIEQYK